MLQLANYKYHAHSQEHDQCQWMHLYEMQEPCGGSPQKKNQVTINKRKRNGYWMAKSTNVHQKFCGRISLDYHLAQISNFRKEDIVGLTFLFFIWHITKLRMVPILKIWRLLKMLRKENTEYFQKCKQWPSILGNVGASWGKLTHEFLFFSTNKSLIYIFFSFIPFLLLIYPLVNMFKFMS